MLRGKYAVIFGNCEIRLRFSIVRHWIPQKGAGSEVGFAIDYSAEERIVEERYFVSATLHRQRKRIEMCFSFKSC